MGRNYKLLSKNMKQLYKNVQIYKGGMANIDEMDNNIEKYIRTAKDLLSKLNKECQLEKKKLEDKTFQLQRKLNLKEPAYEQLDVETKDDSGSAKRERLIEQLKTASIERQNLDAKYQEEREKYNIMINQLQLENEKLIEELKKLQQDYEVRISAAQNKLIEEHKCDFNDLQKMQRKMDILQEKYDNLYADVNNASQELENIIQI